MSFIKTQTDAQGVATVTLNRPDKHNAFDDTTIGELINALQHAERDAAVRIVVLTGAGKSFSAGADINWMRAMASYSEGQNIEDALQLSELMAVLDNMRKPTIARVNGAVYGGGVGLVCCCDIAIASDTARFALSEVKLGLIPAVISPYVIAAIGERHARRFFLSGEAMDADTALHIGLVHLTCESDGLDAAVEQQIRLLLQGGPEALATAKHLIRQVCHADTDARGHLRQTTAELIAQVRVSEEGQEGLSAFLEKRKPSWIRDKD